MVYAVEMKVTVCFGNVRVVVPCGNGEILVQDLIDKAVTRYRKATGKPSDSWVIVHNLKSFTDGGILDPDDKLRDVADDREQLLAAFEEQGIPLLLLNNGDGTSTSSMGTESPDLFDGSESKHCTNDVEITCDTLPSGMTSLQVRRGSEPVLNRLSPIPSIVCDHTKRWSAAVLDDNVGPMVSTPILRDHEDDDNEVEVVHNNVENKEGKSAFLRFSRDTGRLSILGNNAETFRWVDAADRQLFKFQSQVSLDKSYQESNGTLRPPSSENLPQTDAAISRSQGTLVILRNEGGPLGIHVVPDYDETGRDMGLIVQGIEPGGRIDRDGRLHVQDRIIEINNQSLLNINFQKAQEIFKEALQTSEIRLRLVKGNDQYVTKRPPPPVLPKPRMKPNGVFEPQDQGDVPFNNNVPSEMTKTSLFPVQSRNPNTVLASNTRKIGKKIHIQLTKGSDGLGFSITTRDNPAGGNCPIYIKNILPKGAAVQDGRLKPGDRLLEVNAIEMTGKSQTEAVNILRNTPLGGDVNLVVSRQEAESPRLPREMVDSASRVEPALPSPVHDAALHERLSDDSHIFPWKHREVLMFDIPLNDTGSAGLGVSVKGKTSTGPNGTIDLGIFVKSVITGGAASKDGRLQENDQLVNVNEVSLLAKSNSQAMETLRRAIQQEGPNPNAITLTVARRIGSRSDRSIIVCDGTGSVSSENRSTTPDTNSASEHSEGTVIFVPWRSRQENDDKNFDSSLSVRKIEDKDLGLDVPVRNPVIDRLTGQRTTAQLRNESYYRATHDWANSPNTHPHLTNGGSDKEHVHSLKRMGSMTTSPTVNLTLDDTMIIEDEYTTHLPHQSTKQKRNTSTGDQPVPVHHPVQQENFVTHRTSVDSNATYISQISLDDPAAFARDGFGRQSISEKRHAHMDAKNTDTYQRNKKAREEKERQRQLGQNGQNPISVSDNSTGLARANSADSLLSLTRSNRSSVDMSSKDVGPVLGMKKSSSLESLQTMVAEATQEEDGENFVRPAVKAVRGRGCNESFRAAVDRSYDVPQGNLADAMETLDEESESGSSGMGRGASRQSSLTGEQLPEDIYRFGKKGKKKGLFKGLGQVFKFGKNRKLAGDQLPRLTMQDLERQKLEAEKQKAKKAAQDEQERIQEQYRKLLKRQMEQQTHAFPVNINNNTLVNETAPEIYKSVPSNRHDRISQLRAQHQRKHQERKGQYPGEEQEAQIEQQLHSQLDRQRYDSEVVHSRSRSYDLYREMERPGSRLGFADSSKYSHYANYEEIQHHLRQQQAAAYLSQRERPVSNYFEYESIQARVKPLGVSESSTNSLPRRSHHSKSRVPPPPSSNVHMEYMHHPHTRKDRTKEKALPNAADAAFPTAKAGFRPPGQFVSTSRHQVVNRHRDATSAGSKV